MQMKGHPDVVTKGERKMQVELKTGKVLSAEHRAQVIIYGLFNRDVEQGLYHLPTDCLERVEIDHRGARGTDVQEQAGSAEEPPCF
jgi:hypothetical protein